MKDMYPCRRQAYCRTYRMGRKQCTGDRGLPGRRITSIFSTLTLMALALGTIVITRMTQTHPALRKYTGSCENEEEDKDESKDKKRIRLWGYRGGHCVAPFIICMCVEEWGCACSFFSLFIKSLTSSVYPGDLQLKRIVLYGRVNAMILFWAEWGVSQANYGSPSKDGLRRHLHTLGAWAKVLCAIPT